VLRPHRREDTDLDDVGMTTVKNTEDILILLFAQLVVLEHFI
jgi:hypothetical protein